MKTTWDDIFKSFKRKYPRLGGSAASYKPSDFMTIEVMLEDGQRIIYNGLREQAKMVA